MSSTEVFMTKIKICDQHKLCLTMISLFFNVPWIMYLYTWLIIGIKLTTSFSGFLGFWVGNYEMLDSG